MSTAALPFEPPRPISRKVSQLRLAVRLYVIVEGLAALGIVVGAAFWLGLAIDWMFEPSPPVRVLMWIVAAIVASFVAWRWILRRTFADIRSDSLALVVERTYPELGEGLVTAVQAAGEGETSSVQRQMLDVSARRAAEALSGVQLRRLFDFGPLRRKLILAIALLSAIGVFAATESEAFAFWMQRIRLTPNLWPRRVALSVVGFEERDGQRVINVARDDSFELQVLASITDGHASPDEVEVRWRLADGRRGRGPMLKIGEAVAGRDQGQLFTYAFKVTSDVTFDVVGGDDRIRNLRLHPVERPAVRELGLQCEYPDYLERKSELREVASSRAELPEGSTAVCRAIANKPLVSVRVHDPSQQVDIPVRMAAEPAEFDFDLGRIVGERVLMITMRDVDGVENREPFRLLVSAVPDQAPEVNVQLRGIGTAVTPQARIPLTGRLTDDYGLVEAWFQFETNGGEPQKRLLHTQPDGMSNMRMTEAFDVAEPDPETTRPRVELSPGQKLTIAVQARDAYNLGKEPHIGGSPRFQLDVVTASELRALLEKRELGLRQRFEATYEKMSGVRDLVARIDLAAGAPSADDSTWPAGALAAATTAAQPGTQPAAGEESLTPQRRRERDLARLGGSRQSAAQLAFETSGVAEGFDEILAELVNNRVDTEELTQRLEGGISEPLKEIGGEMLPRFEERLAALQTLLAADSPETAQSLAAAKAESQAIVDAMKAVLDRMLELESYNELVELLRGIVADQDELRERTLREQRDKLHELLEDK